MPPVADRPLLRLHRVSKAFGAVQALTDVDLDVHPGEVARPGGRQRGRQVDAGQDPRRRPSADAGTIRFDGRDGPDRDAAASRRASASPPSTRTSRSATTSTSSPTSSSAASSAPAAAPATRQRWRRRPRTLLARCRSACPAPPSGRRAVGRPAPGRGGRPRRAVGRRAGPARRADRGARRRADRRGAEPRSSACATVAWP